MRASLLENRPQPKRRSISKHMIIDDRKTEARHEAASNADSLERAEQSSSVRIRRVHAHGHRTNEKGQSLDWPFGVGARYRDRTYDPTHVKGVLYR
jgi:hypothetical protein